MSKEIASASGDDVGLTVDDWVCFMEEFGKKKV